MPFAVVEGPVLPDVEGRVPVEVEPAIYDVVVGIDHAQRLPAAHRTGLDAELGEVAPTAGELHDDCGAGSALDPGHADQVVHGDVVAGAGMPLGLLGNGAVSLVVPGYLAPVLSFAAGTLLSLAGIRPFLLKRLHPPGREIKTNVDALVGRVGVVSERIDPGTGRGRVLVEGEDWRGSSLMDTVIEPGTRVMVVRVDGTTLYVDKEG